MWAGDQDDQRPWRLTAAEIPSAGGGASDAAAQEKERIKI